MVFVLYASKFFRNHKLESKVNMKKLQHLITYAAIAMSSIGAAIGLVELDIPTADCISTDELIELTTVNDTASIQFQDLRGLECYAQPDQVIVCGPGDTIPILLFTKSVAPIFDVLLNVEFDEGLEFASFAYVQSGNADLDTISVMNPESPTFRISEISQAGGGVVVYVGVTAACGIDFDTYMPSITFSATYTSAGVECVDEVTPDMTYASNILVPTVAFDGTPSPASINITMPDMDVCTSVDITSLTPGAPVTEAMLTISDYGFDQNVTVSSVSVNGADQTFALDAVTGDITLMLDGNADPALFGGDGQLTPDEGIPVEVCYQAPGCVDIDVMPTFAIKTLCRGETCTSSINVTQHTLRDLFSGGPTNAVLSAELIQEPAFCDAMTGGPVPYIMEVTFMNSATVPIKGDMWNLIFYTDTCTSNFLTLDSAYIIDGPGGAVVGTIPSDLFTQNAGGRSLIDFRQLPAGMDIDGGGDLVDLDGDGVFDDLAPQGEITFRVEFSPSCDGGGFSCGTGGGFCDFRRIEMFWAYNCGRNGRRINRTYEDGLDPYTNETTAEFDNPDMFTFSRVDYEGYDFGQFGLVNPGPMPASSTISPILTITPGADDFATCPAGGDYNLTLVFTGRNLELADIVVSNAMYNGTSATELSNDYDTLGIRVIRYDISDPLATPSADFTFDATLDTAECGVETLFNVLAFIGQECTGCDCNLSAACASSVIRSDPEDDSMNCTAFSSDTEVCRVSTGFTDKTLATKVNKSDISPEDLVKAVVGDTLLVSTFITARSALSREDIDFFFQFAIRFVEGNTVGSASDVMLPSLQNAVWQSFTLKRPDGSIIDIGAIGVPGSNVGNQANGISAGRSQFAASRSYPGYSHPAVSGVGVAQTFPGQSSSLDQGDVNIMYYQFRDPCPSSASEDNDQRGVQALWDALGGEIMVGDTFFMEALIPVICLPRQNARGDAQPLVTPETIVGSFESNLAVGSYNPGLCSGTTVTGTAPRGNGDFTMIKPDITVESRIEYIDECSAEYVVKLVADNTDMATCFADEFRPLVGFEDFELEIPMPYYAESVTIEHAGLAPVEISPDSTVDIMTSTVSGVDYLVPTSASGKLIFIDAEKADGVRDDGFIGLQTGDDDVRLVGGTFPLAGVGLGAAVDSVTIRVQLTRICGGGLMGAPIESTVNVSQIYLHDYNLDHFCNNGFYYSNSTCDGNPGLYWPYDREADGNPGHILNDAAVTATPVGAPPVTINGTASVDPPGPIMDLAGDETVTYTINTPDMPTGGYITVCVDNAVEVSTIGGAAPIEIARTDSTKIYFYDLAAAFGSPLPTGPLDVPIVTDLLFCEEAEICIKTNLGCSDMAPMGYDAMLAAAVGALAGKTCEGVDEVCYMYVAGSPVAAVDFSLNNNQALCAESLQTIRVRNIGKSILTNLDPIVFIPEGYVTSNWMVQLAGSPAAPIVDPTEDPMQTGVYGRALVFPLGTFPDLEEGQTLLITFTGMTTCESVLGLPLAFALTADANCEVVYELEPTQSDPINVAGTGDLTPAFNFEADDLDINCLGESMVTVTAINVGKAGTSDSRLCITLPDGIDITADDITWIAPVGFETTDFMSEPLGTGGATALSLEAPNVGQGGFFCVKLSFMADLECGATDIGFVVKRTETIDCPGDPASPCDVLVASADESLLTLNVTPPASVGEASVTASCSDVQDMVTLDYTIILENPAMDPFAGDATIELFYDLDANGDVDEDIDSLLLTEMTAIAVVPGEPLELTGSGDVGTDVACALVVRVTVPGCTCSEVIIPFEEVIPSFLAELGTDIVLCPGEPFLIDEVCGDFSAVFIPAAAGNVTMSGDGLEISLNDGFGVDAPVQLAVSSSIGDCAGQTDTINVSQLEEFEFGPFNFTVCEVGCTQVDFGVDINLLEDLEITISPDLFLDDPTSAEPTICDPTSETIYEIEFSLNGQCVFETTMLIDIDPQPTIEIAPVTGCTGGFSLDGVATIVPATLDGTWSTEGDGSFTGGTRYSAATDYVPGPADLATGEVQLILRSDTPVGACGGAVARETFTVLLVDCGDVPWDGVTPPAVRPDNGNSQDK